MHEANRRRLASRLAAAGIDAYLAYTPANVTWTTGFTSPLKSISWRLMATDLAIVPADPDLPPAIIAADFTADLARAASGIDDVRAFPLWAEYRDVDELARASQAPDRPAQWDVGEIHRLVHAVLADRGLDGATIGTDLRYIQAESLDCLRAANPGSAIVDATDLLYDLRRVKHPEEIARQRIAVRLFESGVEHAVANLREGDDATALRYLYEAGVLDAVRAEPGAGVCHGVATFIGVGRKGQPRVAPGELVKFDCGVNLDGYLSDCGRTFAFGAPEPDQVRVHRILLDAHLRARDALRPGTPLAEIHRIATESVHAAGLPGYSRGHFGHSIGLDDFGEEPPFFAPGEDGRLEPGMVMCLEVPYYAASLGTFQVEDMYLVTESGAERLGTQPLELVSI